MEACAKRRGEGVDVGVKEGAEANGDVVEQVLEPPLGGLEEYDVRLFRACDDCMALKRGRSWSSIVARRYGADWVFGAGVESRMDAGCGPASWEGGVDIEIGWGRCKARTGSLGRCSRQWTIRIESLRCTQG